MLKDIGLVAGKIAVAVEIIGSLLAFLLWLPLLSVPAGTAVRPMGLCMLQAGVTCISFGIAFPFALLSFFGRRWRISVVALLFSISPYVVGVATYWGLIAMCGLVDSP